MMPIPDFHTLWACADAIEGHLPQADAEILYAGCLVASMNPETQAMPFVEIGSFRGRSSVIVGGFGRFTYLVEPHYLWSSWDQCKDGSPANQWQYTENRCDESSKDVLLTNIEGLPIQLVSATSAEAAQHLEGPFAFLFIDGNHVQGGIDVDCKLWLPKVASGGIVGFHDYNMLDYPFLQEVVDLHTKDWPRLGHRGSLLLTVKP